VVVVPIYKNDEELAQVRDYLLPIIAELKAKGIRVKFDDDDQKRPGWKFAEHELKGVPLRLVAGPKDVQNGVLELARRDQEGKQSVPREGVAALAEQLLADIQQHLFNRAKTRLQEQTYRIDDYTAFKQQIETGGFVLAHWDGTAETEVRIKEETKATIRCIPLDATEEPGVCILTGKPSNRRVLFAQAY
jgi:prolyl-tRNA synthetase